MKIGKIRTFQGLGHKDKDNGLITLLLLGLECFECVRVNVLLSLEQLSWAA